MIWSFVKSKSQTSAMPSCLKFNNSTFNSGHSICNAFSDYFLTTFLEATSVNSDLSENILQSTSSDCCVSDISATSVDEKMVEKLLIKLDPAKSAGPDNIPASFLIKCASTIVVSISLLFKRSLAEHTVPNIRKCAYITPIFKKGAKAEISNYRPISKLCMPKFLKE